MALSYKYSGVKRDGTHEVIAVDFNSKNRAFISASASATQLRCHSNPKQYIRLEVQEDTGEPIDEYKNHEWLRCVIE